MECDESMTERYDTALMGILQHEGQIAKFLNVVLGFLYRRTDFYIIMDEKNAKLGFPPGIAAKLLFQAYKHFEILAETKYPRKTTKSNVADVTDTATPPVAETIEIETDIAKNSTETPKLDTPSVVRQSDIQTENSQNVHQNEEIVSEKPDSKTSNQDNNTGLNIVTPASAFVTQGNCATGPELEAKMDQSCDTKDNQMVGKADNGENDESGEKPVYTADAECYNGAVRDNYSWSQAIGDLDIYVKVPADITKGKQVKVSVQRKRIMVAYVDKGSWLETVNGELSWDVKADESMWTLVPAKHVHINLEKQYERWWESLLADEPKINVRNIDASRPMTDLGEEEQAKIGEMMFNEQQKRRGLPQSHDMKNEDLLRKAWDAEGSPFKGQPFDPSVLSNNSGAFSQFPPQ